MSRRPRGTGSIITRDGAYYGKWRVGQRQYMRKLGPVRDAGTREGLTQAMAEAKLRGMMTDTAAVLRVPERITVEDAGRRYLAHLEAMGRKPSTMRSYRSLFDAQLVKRIGGQPIAQLTRDDVDAMVLALVREKREPKTIRNLLGLLHGVCAFAVKRGWATVNPCQYADRPKVPDSQEIRYLDGEELEAVIRVIGDDAFGRVHRAIVLTAAMAGLRRGECIALRWLDVDWAAQRLRVRRNYVRGTMGTPKTRRGSRSVPLADRLGGELDRLHRHTAYSADDDLVFGNPLTGLPLDGEALTKTFQRYLNAAGVRKVRFHDLRHTFGTRMAAAGVPIRTLQEWLGHGDISTTQLYADYMPGAREADLVNRAFAVPQSVPQTEANSVNSDRLGPVETGETG